MSDALEVPAVPESSTTVAAAPINTPAPLSTTAAALARCLSAYKAAYAEQLAKGKYDGECTRFAKVAYRKALPITDTLEDIQAFIACVAQGINFEMYDRGESTLLLYAAQVALGAQRRKPEKR
jgi:hypothetical protein